jgi:hypothetical protein
MRKTLFTLTLMSGLGLMAAAQESRIPLTARDNPQATSAQPDSKQIPSSTASNLPFCPTKTCLYYAGDFDSTDSTANGLDNANELSAGREGQTWVGVKPPKAAMVTGATFNQFFTAGFVGTNPTPFQTRIGIVAGEYDSGTIVCNTTGNATMKPYGESYLGYVQYSYTVKKLAKACTIAKPTKKYPSTYVNLLPTSANGFGYVVNVEDAKPKNHRGWKNDLNDCYLNEPLGEINYSPCNEFGLGQYGFSELSIALTGKNSE